MPCPVFAPGHCSPPPLPAPPADGGGRPDEGRLLTFARRRASGTDVAAAAARGRRGWRRSRPLPGMWRVGRSRILVRGAAGAQGMDGARPPAPPPWDTPIGGAPDSGLEPQPRACPENTKQHHLQRDGRVSREALFRRPSVYIHPRRPRPHTVMARRLDSVDRASPADRQERCPMSCHRGARFRGWP